MSKSKLANIDEQLFHLKSDLLSLSAISIGRNDITYANKQIVK